MPRTFFLSPDPKPNHPFEVTFVIEGADAEGNPLAVVDDEYVIAVKAGSILFDKHALRILSVDEKENHRAELKFVSREGFSQSGEFELACILSRNPNQREETTVTVVAPNIATETVSSTEIVPDHAIDPSDLCFLDMRKLERTVEPSDVPLTETPNPTPTPETQPKRTGRIKYAVIVVIALLSLVCVVVWGAIRYNEHEKALPPSEAPRVSTLRLTEPDAKRDEHDVSQDTEHEIAPAPVPAAAPKVADQPIMPAAPVAPAAPAEPAIKKKIRFSSENEQNFTF